MNNHVHKRPGSKNYQYRRKVPAALVEHYQKREIVFSLGTPDPAEAKRLGAQHTVRLDDEFAALLNPADVPPKIAGEYFSRTEAERLEENHNPPDGADFYADDDEGYATWLASLPLAEQIRVILREQADAQVKQSAQDTQIVAQVGLQSPATASAASSSSIPVEAPAGPDKHLSLAALAGAWEVERKPVKRTVAKMDLVVREFYTHVGRLPYKAITRAHVIAYKDALLKAGKSPGTTDLQLNMLRTLFNYAVDNDKVTVNAAQGVRATPKGSNGSARSKRLPFDLPALKLIFGCPIYTEGARPIAGRGIASYWLPLLAMFTGARLEEIGQLSPCDVYEETYFTDSGEERSAWVIRITAQGDGQSLKNESSERRVPIHADVIARGFLDLVARRRGQRRIFDLVPDTHGVETGNWGSWFSGYLRTKIGVTDKRMTFHSFRHLFKDTCRARGISEDVHDALTGHAGGGEGRRTYGGLTYPLGPLVDAVGRYKVHGLTLLDKP
jgi:integrase